MYELIYTSAPRGLRASASGYTVVAQTTEIPAGLVSALEGLSQYRHRTVSANADDGVNPVMCGHYLLTVGYQRYHVLSRIVDSGLDYSGRGNFLAHHLATTDDRLPPGGPGWVLNHPDVFLDRWDKAPETLPPRGHMRAGDSPAKPCHAWKNATGDAGWGGVLAASVDPAHPVIIVFRPDQDVLALIAESLALLPPDERWEVSFSSYYLGTPAGVRCQWRCVPSDSPDLSKILASGSANVIRVDRMAEEAPEGPLVEAARTGNVPPVRKIHPASPPPAPSPVRKEVRAPVPQPASLPDIDDDEESQPTPAPARPFAPPPSSGFAKLFAGFGIGALLTATLLLGIEAASGKGILGLSDDKKQPNTEVLGAEKPVVSEGISKADLDKAVKDAVTRNEETWQQKEKASEGALANSAKELDGKKKQIKDQTERAEAAENELKALKKTLKNTPAVKEESKTPPDAAPESEEDSLKLYKLENKRFLEKTVRDNVLFYDRIIPSNAEVLVVGHSGKITISTSEKSNVGGKEKLICDMKIDNVSIGHMEVKTNAKDKTVEIAPPALKPDNKVKLPTPCLHVGLIQVKDGEKISYYLAYPPFQPTDQRLDKRNADNTPKPKVFVWEKMNFVKEVTNYISDYKNYSEKYYLDKEGDLGFRGTATVNCGKGDVILYPVKGTATNIFAKSLSSNETGDELAITMEIEKDGQLIVTTPLGVEKCSIQKVEVVRPVKIKDFKGTWLPVIQIPKLDPKMERK